MSLTHIPAYMNSDTSKKFKKSYCKTCRNFYPVAKTACGRGINIPVYYEKVQIDKVIRKFRKFGCTYYKEKRGKK